MIINVGDGGASNAQAVKYDNTKSKLKSTEVQGAIDEVTESLENSNTYSTEEKVIGKWINGKPLYRKVIVYDTFTNSSVIDHNIQNVEHIHLGNGSHAYRSDVWSICNFYNTEQDFFFQLVSKTKVHCKYASNHTFSNFVFVLEYTKTTD